MLIIQFILNNTLKKPSGNILLLPFSLIYGMIVGMRNWLFDSDIRKSISFDIPTISVGNLSVGGTGKTPHSEYLIALLQKKWNIALLSRGYKRNTSGFVLANESCNSNTIGDEPYQIFKKFPSIVVAVDEKRVHGIKILTREFPHLQAIIMDDAFQHRQVQPGLSILLTDYNNLYTQDKIMPSGTLREHQIGSKRANIIVVTKCPLDMKPLEMRLVVTEIKPENNQLLFFSAYKYDEIKAVFPENVTNTYTYDKIKRQNTSVLLVAGVASPEPLIEHVKNYTPNFDKILFDDHHNFLLKDFESISRRFARINASEKIILVTEKDASRLISSPNYPDSLKQITYMMPIKVQILNDEEAKFNQKILNYVVENPRNC